VTAQLLVVADECEQSAWARDVQAQRLERADADVQALQAKYLEA
jgi:hypothetical protein